MRPAPAADPSAPDVTVLTSGHDVADARLHRMTRALRLEGLRVEVLGLGDPAGAPEGATVTTRPRGSLLRRAGTAVRYAVAARGRVVVALDPDALLAARLVAGLRRRPVVADVHEDYAALLADREWARGLAGRLGAAVAHLATRVARGSDLVLVADDHVPPTSARTRLVVRNLPDPGLLPPPTPPGPTPRAVYVGDARPSRGLWAMLDAVAAAPGWELDVVGPVPPAVVPRLDRRLAEGSLHGRVRFHGRRPPAEAWRVAAGAWCGLALLDDTRAFRDAVPSKLYEYLACGLPVVVTDLPRQAAIVEDAGAGAVVTAGPDRARAAAAVLRRWSEHPADHDRTRERVLAWRGRHLEQSPYAPAAGAVAALARTAARGTMAGRPGRPGDPPDELDGGRP